MNTHPTPVYVVETNRTVAFASPDLEAAKSYAQAWTNAQAVRRPWDATPHVIVQTWHGPDTDWEADIHVYAEAAPEAVMDEADTMRRVTGSMAATVRHEHVEANGTVVVDAEATSYAEGSK